MHFDSLNAERSYASENEKKKGSIVRARVPSVVGFAKCIGRKSVPCQKSRLRRNALGSLISN